MKREREGGRNKLVDAFLLLPLQPLLHLPPSPSLFLPFFTFPLRLYYMSKRERETRNSGTRKEKLRRGKRRKGRRRRRRRRRKEGKATGDKRREPDEEKGYNKLLTPFQSPSLPYPSLSSLPLSSISLFPCE